METSYDTDLFEDREYNSDVALEISLEAVNELLGDVTPKERIQWAVDKFGPGLYALTSAGIDSALMMDLVAQAETQIPVIHLNTGFLPVETLEFRDKLVDKYGLELYEFGPTKEQVSDIAELRLWDGDLGEYSKITKLKPMSKAIKQLSVKALLTGVRRDQTENRSGLGIVGLGNDQEFRINPFIDWSSEEVKHYFKIHNLPRHPLYYQYYGSVGDVHATVAGDSRNGRTIIECGLHVVDGRVLKQTK